MKFLFLLFLAPSLAFGQLEIKERKEPKVIGEIGFGGGGFVMKMIQHEESGFYQILFRNMKYRSTVDIKSFNIHEDDIETLYNAINEGLTKQEKKVLEIELDNGDMLTLMFKGRYVSLMLWNGSSSSFSNQIKKNQLDRLFGKTN